MSLRVEDITVTTSDPNFIQVYEGKCIVIKDTMIVFQFDETVQSLLEGELNGKINGITIFHIPVEKANNFERDLTNLLNYIIFKQQNEIVLDKFWVVTPSASLYNKARSVMLSCQKKITKNDFKLFPNPEKACFNKSITGYNFTVAKDNNQSYFATIADPVTTTEEEELEEGLDPTIEEPYKSDGWKYVPVEEEGEDGGGSSEEGGDAEPVIHYKRVTMIETHTISLKGFYTEFMGIIASSIENGGLSITITRKLNPDAYMQESV